MDDKKIKILLVDDEEDILEFVSYNLRKEGFLVELANNGKEAILMALKFHPDLILLDVMMPEMDGVETCLELRKHKDLNNTLIAFLTARSEDYSQIAGLEAGADDYISKPIKPKLLISRVKALLRRVGGSQSSAESEQIQHYSGIALDVDKYIVTKNGEEFHFPRKEFELLAYLMSKPGKVFRRDDILEKVWGAEVIVGDRTIDVHIRKLREKLGNDLIKTIKGVGYKID